MANKVVNIIKTHVEHSDDSAFKLLRIIPGRGSKPNLYIYESLKLQNITQPHVGDVVYTINDNDINSLLNELSNMQLGGFTKRTKRRKHKKSRKTHKKSKKQRH